MTNLYIRKDGVSGKTFYSEKVGIIRVSTIDDKAVDNVKRMLTVDNFSGFDKTYKQREEPEIKVFDTNNGTSTIFTGTHQQLVEKLTYNPKSLLETLFHISYEMGFQKFYSGNIMADMATAIDLAKRFEQEHKDTDWDQEDWLLATSEFIEDEIKKLKKEK